MAYQKTVLLRTEGSAQTEMLGFKINYSKSKQKSHSSSKSSASGQAGFSAKAGLSAKAHTVPKARVASKTPRRSTRKPRGHGNFGDVRVIRNPDGSIETYDAN